MPERQEQARVVRLVLGDQLNHAHGWWRQVRPDVLYVLMEVRQETDYAWHHIQKVLGFFGAMRRFAEHLRHQGHRVRYLTLDDPANQHDMPANLASILAATGAEEFGYQLPDEWRLDAQLKAFAAHCGVKTHVADTEHFLTTREELGTLFKGKKQYLMERFYRVMRERTGLLMHGDQPQGGQWNFDHDNRQRPPKGHVPPPLFFDHDLRTVEVMVRTAGVHTIGAVDAAHFPWPLDREESLLLLQHFCDHLLFRFGTYQDAMSPQHWAMYHARLSFSMNVKLLSPLEVCEAAVTAHQRHPQHITLAQVEGFVRQIIGWREYMRGVYWAQMPTFAQRNFLANQRALPAWYWTGRTRMACLRDAINGSLTNSYAHHIQRLMVTGNFALLAGVHPDEVDRWYLGIYIDAIEWVEITNTRGMSQFADGGLVGTKPYVSSGAYINKMSHHCGTCYYDVKDRTGPKACPFNALYWHFLARDRERLLSDDARPGMLVRMGMAYRTWDKMPAATRQALLDKGDALLAQLDAL
ncbi:MAG: cryptochrome/photolyase family protein [Flavobacteriales bacterium]|nr:cryptochrome/photolyase family protein [Flavobacteriales bacterium]